MELNGEIFQQAMFENGGFNQGHVAKHRGYKATMDLYKLYTNNHQLS